MISLPRFEFPERAQARWAMSVASIAFIAFGVASFAAETSANAGKPPDAASSPPPPTAVQTWDGKPVYELSAVDRRPVARFQARPQYPFEMRRAGVEGEVIVDFIVTAEGDVANPFATRSTRPEFEAAAVQAVARWKFKPGMKDGSNVPTHLQMPIVFTRSGQ